MSKLQLALVGISLLFVLTPLTACDTTSNTSDFKTYRNDKLGFIIDYPKAWRLDEYKWGEGIIEVRMSSRPTGAFPFVSIYTLPPLISVDKFLPRDIALKQETYPNFTLGNIHRDMPNWDLVYEYTFYEAGLFEGRCYHKSLDYCYYELNFIAPRSQFSSFPFDKILSSFLIINEKSYQ